MNDTSLLLSEVLRELRAAGEALRQKESKVGSLIQRAQRTGARRQAPLPGSRRCRHRPCTLEPSRQSSTRRTLDWWSMLINKRRSRVLTRPCGRPWARSASPTTSPSPPPRSPSPRPPTPHPRSEAPRALPLRRPHSCANASRAQPPPPPSTKCSHPDPLFAP